ncbi:MAG: hypothetical protein ABSB79_12695 [Syntrophales bacterium]|jgi:hypothetical protein
MQYSNINDTGMPGVRIAPHWTNSGNTPTRNLQLFFAPIVRSTTELSDPDFSVQAEKKIKQLVLGPKITVVGGLQILTEDDLIQIQKRKLYVYFWGEATYSDVFPGTKAHITRFCQRVIGIGHTGKKFFENNADIGFIFAPCDTHNCMDEECNNQ